MGIVVRYEYNRENEHIFDNQTHRKLTARTIDINNTLFFLGGDVRTGPPVGVGIGSLPMTPNKNGEIGVLCVESDLAGIGRHNKT